MKFFNWNIFRHGLVSVRKSASDGYTIIEVLVALAIFSIGVMATAALQSASLKSTGDVSRNTQAWAVLEEQVADLKEQFFYETVQGIDYDDDGSNDTTTAHPTELRTGVNHSENTPDGLFTVYWQVTDDVPVGTQNDGAINLNPPKGKSVPAGTYTVSKTLTVWVNQAGGSAARADAIAITEFVKVWVADGLIG